MTSDKDIVIRAENLYKLYGTNKSVAREMLNKGHDKSEIFKQIGVTVAVDNVTFEVERGKIYVLIGLSGSGKSTVIRCLNMLNVPSSGKVLFEGRDVSEFNKKELLEFRRSKISMVFQNFGLMSHRDVLGNFAYGLEVRGVKKADRELKAMEIISMVGLDGWEDHSDEHAGGDDVKSC